MSPSAGSCADQHGLPIPVISLKRRRNACALYTLLSERDVAEILTFAGLLAKAN